MIIFLKLTMCQSIGQGQSTHNTFNYAQSMLKQTESEYCVTYDQTQSDVRNHGMLRVGRDL